MTDKPRWHAEITGKFVQFLSRDPAKPNSRLASRWKAEYHTLKDAKEAKRVREERGYPLWPDDMRVREKARKPEIGPTRRIAQQEDMRL